MLRLLADGMSLAGTANQFVHLGVDGQDPRQQLYEKLDAANRAQALMTALRIGLLEAPDTPAF